MYLEHFKLSAEPFSIAPDPDFLFLSKKHNEALSHLLYGLSNGGFVLLTGEVGTGKTTLLRNLLRTISPETNIAPERIPPSFSWTTSYTFDLKKLGRSEKDDFREKGRVFRMHITVWVTAAVSSRDI